MEFAKVMDALGELAGSVGFFGAGLAALCAAVAMVALARNATGLLGGALAIWVVAAMISAVAIFSQQWQPLLFSALFLAGGLAAGGVIRALLLAVRRPRIRTEQVKAVEPVKVTSAPILQPRAERPPLDNTSPMTV